MAEIPGRKAARRIMNSAGYGSRGGHLGRADGGAADDAEDRSMVRSGVGQHESAMHPGRPKTRLRFQEGGSISGEEAPPRHDSRSRRGHGEGRAPRVNILIHSSPHPHPGASAMDQGAGAGPGAPPPPAPPGSPPPGMPGMPPHGGPGPLPPNMGLPQGTPLGAGPGGPLPPGLGGMPPRPPGMARGGRAGCDEGGRTGKSPKVLTAGSGSGAGRLAKIGRSIPSYARNA
jgi:hypothetical protein